MPGRVRRVAPAADLGTVDVEVALDGELPDNARPEQSVDGAIETEHAEAALQLPRPVGLPKGSDVQLFRVDSESLAHRVSARIGRRSLDAVEVLAGLEAGQTVILSDMSEHSTDAAVRIE